MEFENLQIEIPNEEDEKFKEQMAQKVWEKTYHNQNKGFVVGFDLNSKEALDKRKQRARRFNMKKEEKISRRAERFGVKEDEQIQVKQDPFYEIALKDLSWPAVTEEALDQERPEALYFYGVNHMSTKDVFGYFKDYGPDTLEWIDDVSCIVVWSDDVGASKAMNGISRTYDQLAVMEKSTEVTSDDIQANVSEDVKRMWRCAAPSDQAEESLFLRQATKSDKKLPGAASRSQYYLMYGGGPVNRREGKTGLVSSSRKRKLNQQEEMAKERYKSTNPDVQFMEVEHVTESEKDSDEEMDVDDETREPVAKRLQFPDEGKTKPRMRMYADDVQDEKEGTGIFGRLGKGDAINIEVTSIFHKKEGRISGVNRRLDTDRFSSDSEDDEDEGKAKDKEDGLDKEVLLPPEETDDTTAEIEIVVQDEDDTLYVGEETKVKEIEKDNDLRKQLDTKDLRGLLKKKTVDDTTERTNKGVMDLREKLRQRRRKGFDPDKVNLCIEVTEVSEEEFDEGDIL